MVELRDRVDTSSAPHRHRWLILVLVGLALLLVTLDNSILYTALPTITADMGATASESLWIVNAYPIVMTGLLLGAGTLGDRFGHRRLLVIGLAVFATASGVAAFAPNPAVLIGSRALLAVGAASMMPATLAMIRVAFTDPQERALAISVWGSLSIVGAALGPVLGGALLEWFWWGAVFLVNVPVAVLAIAGIVRVAPRPEPARDSPWDLASSVLALVGLTGVVFAIKELARRDGSDGLAAAGAFIGVVGLVMFVRRQRRLAHPLLEFSIFGNRAVSAGVVSAGAAMFVIAGLQLVTTQRFQYVAGYSPTEAGLLVAAIAVSSVPTMMWSGSRLQRVGLLVPITLGLVVTAVGVVIVSFTFDRGVAPLLVGLAVIGAGLGFGFGAASAAIVGNVAADRAGMASSVEEVSFEMGGLLGVAILGSAVSSLFASRIVLPLGAPPAAADSIGDAVQAAADLGPVRQPLLEATARAYDSSYQTIAWIIAAVVAVAAVGAAVLLRRHTPGTPIGIDH